MSCKETLRDLENKKLLRKSLNKKSNMSLKDKIVRKEGLKHGTYSRNKG
jgi:hypothetical protein